MVGGLGYYKYRRIYYISIIYSVCVYVYYIMSYVYIYVHTMLGITPYSCVYKQQTKILFSLRHSNAKMS